MYGGDAEAEHDVDAAAEISQEDAWAVISSYFEDKGLVRQQLDSFNEFINSSMQEIVDENSEHVVTPQAQYDPSTEVRRLAISVDRPQMGKRMMLHTAGQLDKQHFSHHLKAPCMLDQHLCSLHRWMWRGRSTSSAGARSTYPSPP